MLASDDQFDFFSMRTGAGLLSERLNGYEINFNVTEIQLTLSHIS